MPAIRSQATNNKTASRKGQSEPCPICHVRTARPSDMSRHIMSHESYENKKYQCPYCEYRSSVKDAFNAHVNKHEDKTVNCKEEGCGAKFRDRSSLSRHRSRCHKGIKPKPRAKKSESSTGPNWSNAYPRITFVPQYQPASLSRAPSVSNLSASSETSESDEELLTPPLSLSPQHDMHAYSVLNQGSNLSQFNPTSDSTELFASTCDDMAPASMLYNDISTSSDSQHPSFAVTDFYGAIPQEPYMTGALHDFSFDTQENPDYSYFNLQSLSMGFTDGLPFTEDCYTSSDNTQYPTAMDNNGLFNGFQQGCLTTDGSFPFESQTTESLSSTMALGSSSSTDNILDSFNPYSQTSASSNIVRDPLQDLDFSWFTETPAPAPGYIF